MASVPAATVEYTPSSNVFREETLQKGRFRLPESPSQSVTSLEVLAAEKVTANNVSVATGDNKQSESKTKDNNEAAERSDASVSEIRAITEKIAELEKLDDDKESEDDSSDSDGEIERVPRETGEQEKPVEPFIFMNRAFEESDTVLFKPPPKPPRAAGMAMAQSTPNIPADENSQHRPSPQPQLKDSGSDASPSQGSSLLRRNSSRRNRTTAVIGSTIVVKTDDQQTMQDDTDQAKVVKRKAGRLMAKEQKEALRRSVSMGSDFFISELGKDDGEEERKKEVIRQRKTSPLVDRSQMDYIEMPDEQSKRELSPTPSGGSANSISPYSSIRNIPVGLVNDIRAEMDALMSRINTLEEENKVLPVLRDQIVSLEQDKQELQSDLEGQGSDRPRARGARGKSMSSSLISLQLLQEENRRIPDLLKRVNALEEENRQLKQKKQVEAVFPQRAETIGQETKTMALMMELERIQTENKALREQLEKRETLSQSPVEMKRHGDDDIRRQLRESKEKNKSMEQDIRRLQKKAADAALLTQVADSAITKWRELEQQVKVLPKLRSQMTQLQEEKSRLEAQLANSQSISRPVTPAQSSMISSASYPLTPSSSASSIDTFALTKSPDEGIQLKLIEENVKLKKVNERLRGECGGLAQSVNNLKGQLTQQKQQLLDELEGTKLELTVDKQQLEQEIERLKQQNRRLLMEARKNKSFPPDALTKIEELEVQTKTAQEQVKQQKEDIAQLKEKLSDTESEVTDLRLISEGLKGFFARLAELQQACGIADVAVDNVAHATEVIEETHGLLQKLQSSCETLRQDRDKLQYGCEAARSEVAIVQGKMHDYVHEIASLEKHLQDGNRALGTAHKQNEQLLIEKQELLETVRGLRVENGSLWQQSKELEEQKKATDLELDKTARALGVEKRQGTEWKMRLTDSEETINSLRDEVKSLKSDKREVESRLKIVETTNAEKHRLALELKEQEVIMSVQEKFQKQLQDVESVVEERQQSLESHITYLEEMNEEKAKRCQELQATVLSLKERNGSLQHDLRELTVRVQTTEDELLMIKSQKEILDKQNEQLSQEKSDLQRTLDDQKALLMSLQQAREQLQENESKRVSVMVGLETERDTLRAELSSAKNKESEKDVKLQELQILVNDQSIQLAERDVEIQKCVADHEKQLEERQAEAGIEIRQQQQQISQLQLRISELQKELPAAEVETQRLREATDQLKLQLSTSESRLAAEQHRSTKLSEDLDMLSDQLEKEKTERQHIQGMLDTARKQATELNSELVSRDKRITEMQRDYDVSCESVHQLEKTQDELIRDKAALEESCNQLKAKCGDLEEQCKTLTEQCQENDTEFQQMTTSLYSVSSRVEELETMLADVTDIKANLEVRLEELTSQARKAEQRATEQLEESNQLQERNTELMRRVKLHEDETVPKIKEEALLLEKEKLDLENSLSLVTIKLNGLEEQVENLQRDVDDTRKAKVEVEYKNDSLSHELTDLKSKEGDMMKKVGMLEKSLTLSEKQLKHVRDAKSAADEEIRSYKSRVVSLQLENEQAEDVVKELQMEHQRLENELARMQESLNKQSSEVEQDVMVLKTSLEAVEQTKVESETKMAGLREDNKKLRSECHRLETQVKSLEEEQRNYILTVQASAREVERLEAANAELSDLTKSRSLSQSDSSIVLDSDEVQFLRSDNSRLKDKVHHLEESVEQSREENRQIQLVIDEMEQSIPAITGKNKELQDQNKALRHQIQLLSTKLKDVQELDQEKLQLEWKLQDMEQTLPMIRQQKEVSDVKAQEAEELLSRCQQLGYQVADLEDELSVQRLHAQQVPLLQEQCKFKQKEVKSLEGEIKIMGREIKELELEVAVWKQKTQQLKEDKEMLLSDVSELKQANQNLALLVDVDKQDHVERDAQDLASLKQVIAELERDNQQLQKQLDKKSATQQQLEEENREMVHLNDLVLELEEENSKLQAKHDRDKRKVEELTQQMQEAASVQKDAQSRNQEVQSLTNEVSNLEAHVSELLRENEQIQGEVNQLRKSLRAEADQRSNSPGSTQQVNAAVLSLGTRVRELESVVAELQDELDRSQLVQNGTDDRLDHQGDRSPPRRRIVRRLSFLPSPKDRGNGYPDFAVEAGFSTSLHEACSHMVTVLDAGREPSSPDEVAAVDLIKRHWFTLTAGDKCPELQLKKWVKALAQMSHSLLNFVINCADGNGNSALHYLVSHSNFPCVEILLDSNYCNVNIQNAGGYTAVMLTAPVEVCGHVDRRVLRKLFLQGDVNIRASRDGQTALMLAVTHGNVDLVKLLVAAKADASIQDIDGSTALMCACEHGQEEIARLLLAQPGCNVNAKDNVCFKILLLPLYLSTFWM
jgi:chromosome segregation ATPase